jgi:hypothetical protein
LQHRSLCRALPLLLAATAPAGAQSARLVGTVIDSVHHAPLRDATVVATPVSGTLDSVFHMTHTDAKGQFVIAALRPGRYTVSVEHAFTDSIGLDVPPRIVAITGDGTAHISLALPSVATLRRTLCPAALNDTTLGVMLGVVRQPDGSLAAGGRVVLGWSDLSTDKTTLGVTREERTASTTTDSLGVYRACGVPAAVTLLVQAQLGPRQSGVISEQIGEAGVLVRDFTLGLEGTASTSGSVPADSAPQGSVGQGVLTGSVVGMRGERIAAARISLAGTTRSTTVDTRGEFRFAALPTGTQGFEVTALGYLPRRFRAEVTRDSRAGVIRMDRLGVLLDSVRVIARRRYDAQSYPEFEDRLRHRRFGQFVTEEMIEQRHPFLLSDMLRTMPGFEMHVRPDGTPVIQSSRGFSSLGQPTNSSIESEPGGARPFEERRVRGGPGAVGGSCIKIYVNGMIDGSEELNRLVPNAVHGVEVYTVAQAPAKYQSGSCGVVLIWSK